MSDPFKLIHQLRAHNCANNSNKTNTTNVSEEEKNNTKNTPLFSAEINQAVKTKIANSKINSYQDMLNNESTSISIFSKNTTTETQMNQAYTDYSTKLLSDYYDINKDGKTTVEEFAKQEIDVSNKFLKIQSEHLEAEAIKLAEQDASLLNYFDTSGDRKISLDEYRAGSKALNGVDFNDTTLNNTIATRTGNLFAQNLDFNQNSLIDASELAFFNKNADIIDGKQDGVITAAAESAMYAAFTGLNADDQSINYVVNKYLSGENLTTEEQTILDNSQNTIKSNVRKSAGME